MRDKVFIDLLELVEDLNKDQLLELKEKITNEINYRGINEEENLDSVACRKSIKG